MPWREFRTNSSKRVSLFLPSLSVYFKATTGPKLTLVYPVGYLRTISSVVFSCFLKLGAFGLLPQVFVLFWRWEILLYSLSVCVDCTCPSQTYTCLCLPLAVIKGLCHYAIYRIFLQGRSSRPAATSFS